jgi:endonuclease/exonuclease/phosphatase (EEP) superfamily protein YafD
MSVSVFITLVRNDYWIFKIMEYPRLQKLVVVLATLAIWVIFQPFEAFSSVASFILLCAAAVYLVYKISPYTIFTPKEMKTADPATAKDTLKVFAANVYQENTEYQRVLSQIRNTDPDVIFLLETNSAWARAMGELDSTYPYTLKEPLENTYGLLFYSRLPLENGKVSYLVKKGVPSIEGLLILPSGQKVKLWGLHPEPPVPGENLYSTAKDKELMKVAFKARECNLPCVVFGDLNDVAWSHTTELFRKTSELLDPRRGRGFYPTFSARSWFIRFPLDYIFCSTHFELIEMKRLPKNGSDHFATFTHLAFMGANKEQSAPRADGEELAEAKGVAAKPA